MIFFYLCPTTTTAKVVKPDSDIGEIAYAEMVY